MTSHLNQLSAIGVAAMIAKGKISSQELVAACLARIEAREDVVQAWEYLDPEAALAEARERDGEPSRGPLHGVPIGVKDIIDTADMPTAMGSPIYAGHRPAGDAACVALARAAGCVVLGKTVSTEFAGLHPGKTRNPHNPEHTPGGSSSGSAAAVADGMVPLAYGTQTGGSISRPAAFCGVVGFKPSHGTIPRAGLKLISDALDTIGVLGRSLDDVALLTAISSGRNADAFKYPHDPPLRLGRLRNAPWSQAEAGVESKMDEAAATLRAAGASVDDVTLAAPFDELRAAHWDVMHFEVARWLSWEREQRAELLSPEMREMTTTGMTVETGRYQAALDLAARGRALLAEAFGRYDALLTPSAPGEAPAGLEATGDPVFNGVWTFLHVPTASLPVFSGPAGLPMGLQVAGPLRGDGRLLSVARWIEGKLKS